MATAKQYLTQLRLAMEPVALRMGYDLSGAQKSERVLANMSGLTTAVLMKLLVDKGVLTNAELTDAFNFVRDDGYDDEPNLP